MTEIPFNPWYEDPQTLADVLRFMRDQVGVEVSDEVLHFLEHPWRYADAYAAMRAEEARLAVRWWDRP